MSDKGNRGIPTSRRNNAQSILLQPVSPDALRALNAVPDAAALQALGINPATGQRILPDAETDQKNSELLAALTKPVSPEIATLLQQQDTEFQRVARQLLGPKVNLNETLSAGEEFVELTPEQILTRPALTEREILTAPVSKEALAALKVGVLSNRDGSENIYLTGKSLENYILRGGIPGVKEFNIKNFSDVQRDITRNYFGPMIETRPGELHPLLQKRMQTDPELSLWVNYAVNKAGSAGLNGIMFANQLWHESRFNPDAVSGKGARGISQMMPFHQGRYGLQSTEDFFDPFKSIDAGVGMMSEMSQKFKDQRLALIAYNGGEGAIKYGERLTGKSQITYDDWHAAMVKLRLVSPSDVPSAWQNETFRYIRNIAGEPGAVTPQPPTPAPSR